MPRKGKNHKAAEEPKPKGRPGPKGNFMGFRLQYLQSIFPAYLESVKIGKSFWSEAQDGYWERFDWRDHDLKVEANEDHYRNASVPPDVDGSLSEEELEMKTKVLSETNKVSTYIFI